MNDLLKFSNELINAINNSTSNGTNIPATTWKNDIQKQNTRIAEIHQQFLNAQKWGNNLKRNKRNTNGENILNEETTKLTKPFTPEQMQALTEGQIETLTIEEIKAFTPQQIKIFIAKQIKAFTPEQIKEFINNQIAAFTEEQIQALTSEKKFFNYQKWTITKIKSLTSEQIPTLTTEQNQTFTQNQIHPH